MPTSRQIQAVVLSCIALSLLPAAAQLDQPTYDDAVYVNCPYRVAAIFPRTPGFKDFTYTSAGKSAPARQFFTQQGQDLFSVTVVDFTNGPAVDEIS